MSKIPFNVSARTARLIGRENVSNADGAIIELVKNGYDADSNQVAVVFIRNEELYIIDNGHGMTDNVIKTTWMTIGTNNKEVEPYSPNKRIRAGANACFSSASLDLRAYRQYFTGTGLSVCGSMLNIDVWSIHTEHTKNIYKV